MAKERVADPDVGKSRMNNPAEKQGSPNSMQNVLPPFQSAFISSYNEGGNSRRISMGKPNSPKSGRDVIPHYLRASTGSCHDFCKYGRKHAFEEKRKHHMPKRRMKTLPNKQNSVRTIVLEEKKTAMGKLKHSPVSKIQLPDPSEIIRREVLPPSKKFATSSKQDSLNHEQLTENEKKMNFSPKHSVSVNPKPVKVKLSSSFDTSLGSIGRGDSEIKVGRKPGTPKAAVRTVLAASLSSRASGNKVVGTPQAGLQTVLPASLSPRAFANKVVGTSKAGLRTVMPASLSPRASANKVLGTPKAGVRSVLAASLSPRASADKVVGLYTRKYRSLKPLENQNRGHKAQPKRYNNDNVQEITLHVVEAESQNQNVDPTQNGSISQLPPSPSMSSPKLPFHPDSPSLSSHEEDKEESVFRLPPSPSLASPKLSSHSNSPSLSYHDDEDQEESVIQFPPLPASPSPQSSSHQNSPSFSSHEDEDQYESEYTDSEADEFIFENDEIVTINEAEILEGNHNGSSKGCGLVPTEHIDSAPVKLKFRRGKVVDLESDNNGPRRLRFRRGRVLGKDQDGKGDARRRCFKKGVVDDRHSASPSSEKVVLRHQDAQEKKDAQGLFNNVIEETASKLVESQKSKVKALVGAFETVISLQDTRPSTQT